MKAADVKRPKEARVRRDKEKKEKEKAEPVQTISNTLHLPLHLFHFQRRHVERNCSESRRISLSFSLSLSISLCLRSTHSKPLPALQPPSRLFLFVCLGLPRELPVFRSVASRQYIFQVLMAAAHARSHPYCEKHSSSLALSLSLSLRSLPTRELPLALAGRFPFARPISPSKRTFVRSSRGDITRVKYSQAAERPRGERRLRSGVSRYRIRR